MRLLLTMILLTIRLLLPKIKSRLIKQLAHGTTIKVGLISHAIKQSKLEARPLQFPSIIHNKIPKPTLGLPQILSITQHRILRLKLGLQIHSNKILTIKLRQLPGPSGIREPLKAMALIRHQSIISLYDLHSQIM